MFLVLLMQSWQLQRSHSSCSPQEVVQSQNCRSDSQLLHQSSHLQVALMGSTFSEDGKLLAYSLGR